MGSIGKMENNNPIFEIELKIFQMTKCCLRLMAQLLFQIYDATSSVVKGTSMEEFLNEKDT